MRALLVLLAIVLSLTVLGACGSTDKVTSTSGTSSKQTTVAVASSNVPATVPTTPSPVPLGRYMNDGDKDEIGDPDKDNSHDEDNDPSLDYKRDDNNSYHDSDDGSVMSSYGHVASSADLRKIGAAVKRYYAMIAGGNGAYACTQVLPILARATTLDDGRLGPSYLLGSKSCIEVMRRLSRHYRGQLASPIAVTGARVKGAEALAELGSKTMPAGWITLQREHGVWKIAQLFGGALL
jgi:hypothetical protein